MSNNKEALNEAIKNLEGLRENYKRDSSRYTNEMMTEKSKYAQATVFSTRGITNAELREGWYAWATAEKNRDRCNNEREKLTERINKMIDERDALK